jgi:hypothetical protein
VRWMPLANLRRSIAAGTATRCGRAVLKSPCATEIDSKTPTALVLRPVSSHGCSLTSRPAS